MEGKFHEKPTNSSTWEVEITSPRMMQDKNANRIAENVRMFIDGEIDIKELELIIRQIETDYKEIKILMRKNEKKVLLIFKEEYF